MTNAENRNQRARGSVPIPAIPDRENPLRGKLALLGRQIQDVKKGTTGVDLIPTTFDTARGTYFDLLHLIRTAGDVRDVRGMVWHFPEGARPLFMTTQTARVLHDRYEVPYRVFGDDAVSALSRIATGETLEKEELRNQHVPVGDVFTVVRETFGIGKARDLVIATIAARRERFEAMIARQGRYAKYTGRRRRLEEPAIGSFQDVEVIRDAVIELPRLQSRDDPSIPEAASALVNVIEFSVEHGFADLLRRSTASLHNYTRFPSNISLLSSHRQSLEVVQAKLTRLAKLAELARLPDRIRARRSIDEVLAILPQDGEGGLSSNQIPERDPEEIRRRFGALQRGIQRASPDETQQIFLGPYPEDPPSDQPPELPKRIPGASLDQ